MAKTLTVLSHTHTHTHTKIYECAIILLEYLLTSFKILVPRTYTFGTISVKSIL